MRSLPVSVLTLLLIYITSAEGALNAPLNLSVDLLDFQASVYWLPGPGNPIGTRYSVEFTEMQHFSKPVWKKPAGCSNITTMQCHLFPDQFFDYFVRVMAEWKEERSQWTTLERTFQPYKDTQLSSPEMKISPNHHSIHIHLSHKIQAVYTDVPLRFKVDLFRMTPSKRVEHIGKSKSTGVFDFSDLPSGYSYCINASAFHTEMSIIQNLNATGCIFLQQRPRGIILCVGVLLLLVISAGIFLSAKSSLLRTLIKDSYFPKVLLIKGGTAAPQTLNVETPCVLPLSVSDYPQVIESTHDDLENNASENYMEREEYPGICDELENAYGPIGGYSGIDDELENAYGPIEGHPNLYSSAAFMEESEEPLAQEEHPNFDFFAQGSPHVSTETLYWLEDFDDEGSDYSVIYYIEPMESSEEDTDTEQADEDTLESSYEPRAHLW